MPEVKASGHHGLLRSRAAQGLPVVPVTSSQHRALPCGKGPQVPGPWLPVASRQVGWKGHVGESVPCKLLNSSAAIFVFPRVCCPSPVCVAGPARCMCVSVG